MLFTFRLAKKCPILFFNSFANLSPCHQQMEKQRFHNYKDKVIHGILVGFSSTILLRGREQWRTTLFLLTNHHSKKWESFVQGEESESWKNIQKQTKITRVFTEKWSTCIGVSKCEATSLPCYQLAGTQLTQASRIAKLFIWASIRTREGAYGGEDFSPKKTTAARSFPWTTPALWNSWV